MRTAIMIVYGCILGTGIAAARTPLVNGIPRMDASYDTVQQLQKLARFDEQGFDQVAGRLFDAVHQALTSIEENDSAFSGLDESLQLALMKYKKMLTEVGRYTRPFQVLPTLRNPKDKAEADAKLREYWVVIAPLLKSLPPLPADREGPLRSLHWDRELFASYARWFDTYYTLRSPR